MGQRKPGRQITGRQRSIIIVGVGVTGGVNGGVKGKVAAVTLLTIATDKPMANNKLAMINRAFWFFIFGILPLVWWPTRESFELPKVLTFISTTILITGYNWRNIHYPVLFVKKRVCVLDVLLISFWLINLLSSLVNGSLKVGWWGQYYRYEGLLTLLALYGIYYLSSLGDDNKYIRQIVLLGGMLTVCLMIRQWLLGDHGRLTANLGNPNFAGGYLALVATVISKVYWWPIFIGGIMLTGSRTALLGLVTILTVKYLRKDNFIFSLLFVLAITLGLALIMPIREKSHFDNRTIIWQKSLMAISQKPLLGWGRENFETAFKVQLADNDFDLKNIRVDKAHNETLEIGVTSGLVGIAIYYTIVAIALRTLWQHRSDKMAKLGLTILPAFLVMSQFNVLNINQYIFLYFTLGLARRFQLYTPVA